jgi:hypothetical protein
MRSLKQAQFLRAGNPVGADVGGFVGCGDGFSAGNCVGGRLAVGKSVGRRVGGETPLNVGWDVGASSLVGADVGRDLHDTWKFIYHAALIYKNISI